MLVYAMHLNICNNNMSDLPDTLKDRYSYQNFYTLMS